MDVTVSPQTAFIFMMIFLRVGTLVMLMPGIGEQSVPTRLRLAVALGLTLILYPLAAPLYAGVAPTLGAFLAVGARELVVGFGLGLAARLLLSVLQIAGTTIAFQMGLGFAQNVDPTQGIQGALFANFLTVVGITLILATDLHHVFLVGVRDSYAILPPGAALPAGDFAALALDTVAGAFRVAIQVAAPFLVFGLVFYVGLGVLSRLMPQVQIFFLAMPVNILAGFLLLTAVLGAVMLWFLGYVETSATRFLAPPG